MTKAAHSIATVFGVGYAPYAPGTAASVLALPAAWLLGMAGGELLVLFSGIAALAIGAWACEIYAAQTQKSDPSECVIDEVAGQWIACAFAPLSPIAYGVAFLLFRLFDILKPWPVSYAERLHGGLGIMADDVVAAILAGIVIVGLVHYGLL